MSLQVAVYLYLATSVPCHAVSASSLVCLETPLPYSGDTQLVPTEKLSGIASLI